MAKGLMASFVATPMTKAQARAWEAQVDNLHQKVEAWTGNPLQVLDLNSWQWSTRRFEEAALFAEVERDAVLLFGRPTLGAGTLR
jgi:hypothetical protein